MACLKDFDYEDIKVIGRGQYGKAHLVRNGKDQSLVIAKTIDLTCLCSKERETALQEVALLRRLDHPNIVEYKDNFFMGETLVIVMQYCDGGDLAAYIKDMAKKKTRIPENQIMDYFVQVLQALQYIHSERVLHRDLKTSNLFLMKSKTVVKLGDFGISRVLEGSMAAAVTVVGTPYYMSPEVCENKPYTFKSDVWSLGCVLYELCMLKHAFSADNLLGLVYKIVSDKYEPIPRKYTQPLDTLVQRMLEKNADRRPSVRDLLADPYVQSFMNEYVRTRGQCASFGSSSARAGAAAQAGSGAPRAPPPRSGGPAAAAAVTAAAAASPATSSGTSAGAVRPGEGRERPPRRGKQEQRLPKSSGSGSSGHILETPKEAALRRKREAADRKAAELKVAAKQSLQNKTVARQMKEAEFQSTRFGAGMGRFSGSSACDGGSHLATPSTVPGDGGSEEEDDDDMVDEDLDSPLEEISEGDSSNEEYEDDFEDDFCSDDDAGRSDLPAVDFHGPGMLSTVQEEQDFTRVMCNYEQDLARAHGAASPSPTANHWRSGPIEKPAATSPAVTSSPQFGATSPAGSSAAQTAAGPMDMRSRADRLKEDLIRKMGGEVFHKAFNIILEARTRNADERIVKREVEKLVGHANYKLYCFDVDQCVFMHMMYGAT